MIDEWPSRSCTTFGGRPSPQSCADGLENSIEIAAIEAGSTPKAFVAAHAELAADIRAGADLDAKERARRLGVAIHHYMHFAALFHCFTTGSAVTVVCDPEEAV